MKNQYFGDINDYRKYGLIRCLVRAGGFRVLVAWMLTPDDGSTDGKFTKYLYERDKWSQHDSELYDGLRQLMCNGSERAVSMLEETELLKNARWFSEIVQDDALFRATWTDDMVRAAADCDLVFLDPDNGIEVKSKPYGTKNSSKYVYWTEIETLWQRGKSLLIYQHFIREKRDQFITRMSKDLSDHTPSSAIRAFSTPNVLFLLALQSQHAHCMDRLVKDVELNWSKQIKTPNTETRGLWPKLWPSDDEVLTP